jgi:hypothetical protein
MLPIVRVDLVEWRKLSLCYSIGEGQPGSDDADAAPTEKG